MNKEEIITLMAKRTNRPKAEMNRWLDQFTSLIKETLAKRQTTLLLGFGSFTTFRRKARHVVHPQTRERIKIKSKHVPVFRAAQHLRDLVSGKIRIKKKRGRPRKTSR